ncbi:nuclear valosin-containing protein-like isoform X2 [Athalia rosae]|uniref:nuclear valosin-containing protein-like isoform X2 n=1 Tax=Athalia rosae TaxID=37344 RepID=UPI002033F97E|nr:nuclear valosin-containing protein-like isoform X2 [Athalia rosae]
MNKFGKLNPSIDIIPLQGSSSSGDKGKGIDKPKIIDEVQRSVQRDPVIVSRVYSYLLDNEDKTYIDVNEIADQLQKNYRQYRTKKRSAFRAVVRRAYNEIVDSLSKKLDGSRDDLWNEEDEDDEDEVDLERDVPNDILNSQLLKMYKKNLDGQNGNSSDKELIDISSDDEQSKTEETSFERAKHSKECQYDEDPIDSKKIKATMESKGSEELKEANESSDSYKEVKKNLIHSKQQLSSIPRSISSVSDQATPSTSIERPLESPKTERVSKKRKIESDSRGGAEAATPAKKKRDISEPKVRFADIGGNTKVLEEVCKLLIHMKHPEVFKQLGISPPRGFLLHGPPGCGKTLLAHAIAGELAVPLIKVAAPELVAGVSGESESRIRELFEQAIAVAPCVLFIDEVDAVAPHRATAQREMERRIVAQLLACLDDLGSKENGDRVLVLGATNRPDSLDPALRRAGRFDREVSLGIPDREARAGILAVLATKLALAPDVSLTRLAALTPGFVGADLVALIREAAIAAVNRVFGDLKKKTADEPKAINSEEQQEGEKIDAAIEISEPDLSIEAIPNGEVSTCKNPATSELIVPSEPNIPMPNELESQVFEPAAEINTITATSKSAELTDLMTWLHDQPPLSEEYLKELYIEHRDFEVALTVVQPSAKREGFATVPDVTWSDIGSLQNIRQELQMSILAPVRHSEKCAKLGLTTPTGVLLCGPPGCGKTLLAKAIANEAGINFISVKGPELLNMYVGESEKAVRQCFIRARNSAPCVIFFDELDALCPKRSEGDSSATSRVVNQMLTEMDGVEGRRGVFLMAASNRPDIIDPAVLRPGRLDRILYVGLPSPADRVDILRALTKNGTKPKLATDVDLLRIGFSEKCHGYSGADLAALVREAGLEALKELISGYQGPIEVATRHVAAALEKIRPSVQEKDVKHYEKLRKIYSPVKEPDVTPMETPIDAQLVDPTMEAMET